MDDVLAASRRLCKLCLQNVFVLVYSDIVPWEYDLDPARWLDCVITCDGFDFVLSPSLPTLPTLDDDDFTKVAVPPPVDASYPSRSVLANLARCRLSRLCQLPIPVSLAARAALADIAVWLKIGHPFKTVRDVWLSSATNLAPWNCSDHNILRRCLHDLFSNILPFCDNNDSSPRPDSCLLLALM